MSLSFSADTSLASGCCDDKEPTSDRFEVLAFFGSGRVWNEVSDTFFSRLWDKVVAVSGAVMAGGSWSELYEEREG
jgi:hypothetical protein